MNRKIACADQKPTVIETVGFKIKGGPSLVRAEFFTI